MEVKTRARTRVGSRGESCRRSDERGKDGKLGHDVGRFILTFASDTVVVRKTTAATVGCCVRRVRYAQLELARSRKILTLALLKVSNWHLNL